MEDVFEKCKKLAKEYGQDGIYEDSFECGLQIIYKKICVMGICRKSIQVYAGNREVYFHDEYTGETYFSKGNWEKLVSYLLDHEQHEKRVSVYSKVLLLRSCKKEVEKNNNILSNYFLSCGALAKDQGISCSTDYGTTRYTYFTSIEGHTVKVSLNCGSKYRLFIWYDNASMFNYTWALGEKNGKGRYVPGEWEDILYNVVSDLLSVA
ncbi:hypothetical protein J6S55_00345 [Candidatus Saccharibacteria bacterium]|nr:hypothetical protein [Candidatus Saccharibacteria bacterium]